MIREFECDDQHITEMYIPTHEADEAVTEICCKQCGKPAQKVLISRTGCPQFKAGCGGFYKPNC